MIHVMVKKKNDQVQEINLKGHANFDDYGKDIVCAGVSSILTTTVNGILSIKEDAIQYHQTKDNFQIVLNSKDKITEKLLNNMLSLLKELEQDYPKNILVESEEKS